MVHQSLNGAETITILRTLISFDTFTIVLFHHYNKVELMIVDELLFVLKNIAL
jgi:hypothetical protein